eukprot:5653672-Pyramimonas_sp.AAC.1
MGGMLRRLGGSRNIAVQETDHWPRTSGIHLFPLGNRSLEPKWLRSTARRSMRRGPKIVSLPGKPGGGE